MLARRLLIPLLPLLFVIVPTAAAQGRWELLSGPRAIVLFRHANAPGSGDPAGFSLGDCAIATMQYSMLPSSMSLTRTGLAIEQNRSVMHAVTGYLRGMDPAKRPRFVLFGESLGAQTMQDVWRHRTISIQVIFHRICDRRHLSS